MTTYYVRTNGNDGGSGHDGTTPALAWLTIGYAVTHVSAGDTIWCGAGKYRISSAIAPSTMASRTYLYGDTDGSHTGDAGEVVITTYATNDTTAASNVNALAFANVNNWTVGGFTILCGNAQYAIWITGSSQALTFQDLTVFSASGGLATYTTVLGTAQNHIIQRCRFATGASAIYIDLPNSNTGSGDTNTNVLITNCLILNADVGIALMGGTTGTARKTGGVTISNCFVTSSGGIKSYNTVSTTYPCNVYNSFVGPMSLAALNAAAAGQIVEDYNVIVSATARTNVTPGAHSYSDFSRAWRYSMGHESMFGAVIRAYGEWPLASPLLGFGGTSVPTDDINGVTRPASGATSASAALGPFERPNSGTRETSTVHSGANALKIAGPGYQDFALPVAAAETTVTVYVQWDATYAGTKPSMLLLNGGECGVADGSDTATGSSGAWEQLSIGPFTPTSTGFVTIRLLSSDSNGGGAAFFDDFAVS